MRERDKAIIRDLERFRVMRRDDIAALHFSGVRRPVTECNKVLLRLRRERLIRAHTDTRQYLYFPLQGIKPTSTKLHHFLSILSVYRELTAAEPPREFMVEPKYGGKGLPEPDAFAIWKGGPWFIEVQRSAYGSKQWAEKLNRYEAYFRSEAWKKLPWQPKDPFFPNIWIVGAHRPTDKKRSIRVYTDSVREMLQKLRR